MVLLLFFFAFWSTCNAEKAWDCYPDKAVYLEGTAPYTVEANALGDHVDDCYFLNAKVFDPTGKLLDEHEDRYITVFNHLPGDFPYLVLLVDSGGSGCCRNYYFYSSTAPFRKAGELLHGAIWLKTFREDDGYSVISYDQSIWLNK